jgi:putative DNA-invertase from lambdoid prophage Rac
LNEDFARHANQDTISGAKASRPGLERLMADGRLRKFDAVVVYKLDRWGRSLVHCVTGIQEFQALGIRFIAVSQGLDTDESNPTSKLLMHILASVAEFERSLIRERVSAGIKSAQKTGTRSGKPIGRPKTLVGRGRVVELRDAGASWATIAEALGVPSTTIRTAYTQAALRKTCLQETAPSCGKQTATGV